MRFRPVETQPQLSSVPVGGREAVLGRGWNTPEACATAPNCCLATYFQNNFSLQHCSTPDGEAA